MALAAEASDHFAAAGLREKRSAMLGLGVRAPILIVSEGHI